MIQTLFKVGLAKPIGAGKIDHNKNKLGSIMVDDDDYTSPSVTPDGLGVTVPTMANIVLYAVAPDVTEAMKLVTAMKPDLTVVNVTTIGAAVVGGSI